MLWIHRLEIPALCIGYALAYFCPSVQTMWIAVFIRDGWLATSQMGWLASGEQGLMAISAFAVAGWAFRASPRLLAAGGASVMSLANAVALAPSVRAVVLGRLLSGIGAGVLLACITGTAARRRGAQRALALMQLSVVLVVSAGYFIGPRLISQFGPAGLFAVVVGMGGVMTLAALLALPREVVEAGRPKRLEGGLRFAPMLACLALSSVTAWARSGPMW